MPVESNEGGLFRAKACVYSVSSALVAQANSENSKEILVGSEMHKQFWGALDVTITIYDF